MIWGRVTNEGYSFEGAAAPVCHREHGDKTSLGMLLVKPTFLLAEGNLVPENKSSEVLQ